MDVHPKARTVPVKNTVMQRTLAVALALTFGLSACGTHNRSNSSNATSSPAAANEPTATQSVADPLADTDWVLAALDGAVLPLNSVLRLEFRDGAASGFAGCNFFGGAYRLDGSALRLVEVAQTAMLCADGVLMQQEASFFDALRATETYALQNRTLELRDGSGAVRLAFRAPERQALDPATLRNTRWRLQTIAGQTVAGERAITLELTNTGEAVGNAGCRSYRATWQAEADRLRFPAIEMDEETCADPALLAQEGAFTDALSTAHSYRLVDGQLEIVSDRNGPMRFVALP